MIVLKMSEKNYLETLSLLGEGVAIWEEGNGGLAIMPWPRYRKRTSDGRHSEMRHAAGIPGTLPSACTPCDSHIELIKWNDEMRAARRASLVQRTITDKGAQ